MCCGGGVERGQHSLYLYEMRFFHSDSQGLLMHNVLACWQDRIVARLQQPYSLDCIPVEAEYQVGYTQF